VILQEIKEAWENLRLPEQRAFYDSSLKAMRLRANGQVNEDIDLDDMEFDEGKSLSLSLFLRPTPFSLRVDDPLAKKKKKK